MTPAKPLLLVTVLFALVAGGLAQAAELAALTPEGQNNLPMDIVMAGFNQALGGQLAVAAYDQAAFCAESAKLREALLKDTEGKVLILKPAE